MITGTDITFSLSFAGVRSSQDNNKMIALPKTQLIQALTKAVPRGNPASVSVIAACAAPKVSDVVVQAPPKRYTNYSLSKDVTLGALRVSTSLAGMASNYPRIKCVIVLSRSAY